MTKHRQKPKRSKRRKIAGAAALVVAAGAVVVPSVAQASDSGSGGWSIVSFSWWGWGTSHTRTSPAPSPSAVASTAVSASASASATPAASGTPSASPSASGSPTATATATAEPSNSATSAPSSAAPKSSSSPTATAGSADPSPTDRVLVLVNAERAKAGCSALTENAKLTKAAQDHSQDQADHQNMSHTGSDGSSMSDRLARVGYAFRTAGENVAYGYDSPESVMDGWMNSDGHRANILNCSFKEIGIGLAQPGNYWTQDFGSTS
ncbi:CAP domain-containing protein [Streptomyces sp. CA-249302]|uniref:CAP domain-containing protein n=1 Tax=Streptomyces sp. CA-249302 TaxID=3240058 RepID=UPI003D8E9699